MFNKIKELKHLRDQANQIKSMLSQETVQADAAHGKVQLVMDGNQEIQSITIDPSLLNPAEKEKLESAIREATNDAIKKAQRIMAEKLRGMGGLNMPGM